MGDGSDPWVLAQADLDRAVGFVAGTDNDTTNLSLVAAARRSNPTLFLGARQNRPASAPLFAAMDVDALLVPTEVVAHEVYAQLSTPLLWRFLREMPALRRRVGGGARRPARRPVRRAAAGAVEGAADARRGAGARRLARRRARRGWAICCATRRTGTSRCTRCCCWSCGATRRSSRRTTTSSWPGDELLLAGWPAARRALDTMLFVDGVREYVVTGRRVPSSWIWRKSRREETEENRRATEPGPRRTG